MNPTSRPVAILVASKHGKAPAGLEYAPPGLLWIDDRPGWALAANALLAKAASAGLDALFLDDDVTILPDTFLNFDRWRDLGDVIGFCLTHDNGEIISAGHCVGADGSWFHNPTPDKAGFCAHVTASAMFVRHQVLASAVRFPVWPGIHAEDVAFTFDAWLRGFQVLYVPQRLNHAIGPHAAGATKSQELDLHAQRQLNVRLLNAWKFDHAIADRILDGTIPTGLKELVL